MLVETYKIKSWKEELMGVVIKENDDWILIQEIEGDYQVDGYALLKKEFVKKRRSKKWEAQVALVLQLQKHKPALRGFRFGTVPTMLRWIEKRFEIFAFQDKVEESIEIGKVEDIKDNVLGMHFLKANGKYESEFIYDYKLSQLRKISFDTHYLRSLKLLNGHLEKE